MLVSVVIQLLEPSGKAFGYWIPQLKNPYYIVRNYYIFKSGRSLKNDGPSEIFRRKALKNLKDMVCLTTLKFLKAVFYKFRLVHSWIFCLIYTGEKMDKLSSWKETEEYSFFYLH